MRPTTIELPESSAAAIRAILLDGIHREQEANFAQLRQIPSTHALKVLRYFDTLDAKSTDALCAALGEGAFDSLFPNSDSLPLYKRNQEYRKYVDTVGKTAYLDYRGFRSYLAAAQRGGKQLSPKTRDRAEAIIPITAAELRKHIKVAVSHVIPQVKIKHEGQYWIYTGVCECVDVSVTIDYSCPHYQLEYWVTTANSRPSFWGSNFERLLGLNFAHWDNVDQRNVGNAIELLAEHIRYCIKLLVHLPTA